MKQRFACRRAREPQGSDAARPSPKQVHLYPVPLAQKVRSFWLRPFFSPGKRLAPRVFPTFSSRLLRLIDPYCTRWECGDCAGRRFHPMSGFCGPAWVTRGGDEDARHAGRRQSKCSRWLAIQPVIARHAQRQMSSRNIITFRVSQPRCCFGAGHRQRQMAIIRSLIKPTRSCRSTDYAWVFPSYEPCLNVTTVLHQTVLPRPPYPAPPEPGISALVAKSDGNPPYIGATNHYPGKSDPGLSRLALLETSSPKPWGLVRRCTWRPLGFHPPTGDPGNFVRLGVRS